MASYENFSVKMNQNVHSFDLHATIVETEAVC